MINSLISHHNGSIENIRTLPASYYTSEAVLNQEKRSLFYKHWQFVGHVAQIPTPGDYITVTIFDQNVILSRAKNNEIKAYYNVCPHRGHQLVEEGSSGKKRAFTCPYHAWTYSLDGKLMGARGVHDATGIKKSDICLFDIRVATLVDFIFINFDPHAQPFHEFYPGLEAQLRQADPRIESYHPIYPENNGKEMRKSYWNANWKVLIDNFLECYHCETAHPSFSKKLCIPATERQVHEHFTHEITPLSPEPEDWTHPINLEYDTAESHFWFLYPNTAIGRAAGVPNYYISRFDPLTAETTTRATIAIMPDWSDPDAPNRAKLRLEAGKQTGEEDQALCESVQKGMHQLAFAQGWYINDPDAHNISEHALQYFHDLYLRDMAGNRD